MPLAFGDSALARIAISDGHPGARARPMAAAARRAARPAAAAATVVDRRPSTIARTARRRMDAATREAAMAAFAKSWRRE